MSKLRSPINYKSLQLELQEALRADELYKLQNDAKLRAVEQNVPTYEDFRQMVNAAHLTPLKWNCAKPKIKKSWNPIACSNHLDTLVLLDDSKETQKSETVLELLNESGDSLENKVPTTSEQFTEFWRTFQGHAAKFPFLKSLRHNFNEIFRTEIPLALLVEIIDTCCQTVTIQDNIEPIVDILYALSKCSRFSLAVNFMGANEKNMCTRLFSHLLIGAERQNNIAADTIKALALIYEVVID